MIATGTTIRLSNGAATIPIALFMGGYLRFWRVGKVLEVSALGVVLLLAAVLSFAKVNWHPHYLCGVYAPVVVLCEVDFDSLGPRELSKLFVGFTRAQFRLECVLSERAAQALMARAG